MTAEYDPFGLSSSGSGRRHPVGYYAIARRARAPRRIAPINLVGVVAAGA